MGDSRLSGAYDVGLRAAAKRSEIKREINRKKTGWGKVDGCNHTQRCMCRRLSSGERGLTSRPARSFGKESHSENCVTLNGLEIEAHGRRELNARFWVPGVTKKNVVGKLHRHGWELKGRVSSTIVTKKKS